MNHQQVVFHKRVASLYFALKSSSKFLFFSMIALVLRSVGFNPLQVGILRAVSALFSIMLVEIVVICIRSPKERKILAHLCVVLASASVLAYLTIPSAYDQNSSSSLLARDCYVRKYSLNVNGTRAESDLPDESESPSPTEPNPVISKSDLATAAVTVTDGRTASQTNTGFPELRHTPPGQPVPSTALDGNIWSVDTAPPSIATSGFPGRGGVEPDWLKRIIGPRNDWAEPSERRRRDAPNVEPDEPRESQQQQLVQQSRTSTPHEEEFAAEPASNGSSRSTIIESVQEALMDALSIADSPHSLIVACLLLLCIEVCFALSDRITTRLYTNYLDQADKNFDHLPVSHFATLFTLLAAVAVYERFQCSTAPGFELPTALLGSCGVILGLAALVFTCFPVPEKRKIPDRDPVNSVKLTVHGNFRAMLIFLALVVLGAAFGVEQNFLLWHLVENGADIVYITAFIGTPVLVSALLIARSSNSRVRNLHWYLLAALFSVSVRFVSYSFYTEANVKWSVLGLQVLAPLSSTLLWRAVDSFLQQITFPNDHAPISRSMRFAFWGLGFSSGSLVAGYAWQTYEPSFFLFVGGVAIGSAAIALFAINVCARIQDMKESDYMRILETDHQSKRPINHFEETDESTDDESDQVVEFQVKTSNHP